MAWWQVILIFGGVPAALFGAITLLVLLTSRARVPDGIAAAAEADSKSYASRAADATTTAGPEEATMPPEDKPSNEGERFPPEPRAQ